MSEPVFSNDRFPLLRLLGKLGIAVGVVGSIVTVVAFFAPGVRSLIEHHWWGGWAFAGLFGIGCMVAFDVILWRRLHEAVEKRVAEIKPQLKTEAVAELRLDTIRDGIQSRSDSTVITRLWGPFAPNGRLYERLDMLPSNKYFSTELSDAFYELQERLGRDDWRVYDSEAMQALEAAATMMRAYWEPIRPLLDARDGNFNLQILEPPGGTWGLKKIGEGSWEKDPSGNAWNEFYAFVNSLDGPKWNFLRAMDQLEARQIDLRVRSKIGASFKEKN